MFVESLESRELLSVTFATRRAPPLLAASLVGGYVGTYFDSTLGEGGQLIAAIAQFGTNQKAFTSLLMFDGVEVIAQGKVKGKAIQFNVKPQYAAAYEGSVKITAKARLSPDGQTLSGTYKVVVRSSDGVEKGRGVFSVTRVSTT